MGKIKFKVQKAGAPFDYKYRGCFISRFSYGAGFYVHACEMDLAKQVPRGMRANTLKELCKRIDDALTYVYRVRKSRYARGSHRVVRSDGRSFMVKASNYAEWVERRKSEGHVVREYQTESVLKNI